MSKIKESLGLKFRSTKVSAVVRICYKDMVLNECSTLVPMSKTFKMLNFSGS